MKYSLYILLLFPFSCFAQTASKKTPAVSKPSSTDCPTWDNKNKQKNKADYYRSLRSRKPINGKDSSKSSYSYTKPKAETKKVNNPQIPVKTKEVKKDTGQLVKTASKEKVEKEKKTKRLPHRKTTKVRKKKATGCPQF